MNKKMKAKSKNNEHKNNNTMTIQVKLYATLRKHLPDVPLGEKTQIEVPKDATIKDVLKILNVPEKDAKIILVNGNRKKKTDPIQENDLVVIFPPIGGG